MASRGKRILVGCGIGCGVLAFLGILGIASFVVWVGRPGELLEPEQLLGGDTTGYVEWTLRLEDPGTEGFVQTLIHTMQRLQKAGGEELPDWMRTWLIGRQAKKTERDIRQLFPMVAAWTLRPSPEIEEDLHLVTVSVEKVGNQLVLLDWILGFVARRDDELELHLQGREKIYRFPFPDGAITFFLSGNDVFVASDVETARIAVDRLARPEDAGRPGTELERLFASIPADRTLRGAMTNGRGEVYDVWARIAPDGPGDLPQSSWNSLRGLWLGGGLEADGSFAVTLELFGPSAGWAVEQAPSFATTIRDGFASTPFAPEAWAEPSGERIRVHVRIPDLIEKLGRAIEGHPNIDVGSGGIRIEG